MNNAEMHEQTMVFTSIREFDLSGYHAAYDCEQLHIVKTSTGEAVFSHDLSWDTISLSVMEGFLCVGNAIFSDGYTELKINRLAPGFSLTFDRCSPDVLIIVQKQAGANGTTYRVSLARHPLRMVIEKEYIVLRGPREIASLHMGKDVKGAA